MNGIITGYPEHWSNGWTVRPLTESVEDEWYNALDETVVWAGIAAGGGVNPVKFMPDPFGEYKRLDNAVYRRLLCDDAVVVAISSGIKQGNNYRYHFPLVAVHVTFGGWVCAASWQALASLGRVIQCFGRPPWRPSVEIQPVWGKGRTGEVCVKLVPGLRD